MRIFLFLFFLSSIAHADSALLGTWLQTCQTGHTEKESFLSSSVTNTESFYADSACKTPLLQFENSGSYSTNGQNMDFVFAKVVATIFSQELLSSWNERKVCGFSDWKHGTSRDITGLECDLYGSGPVQTPKAGDVRYGIYRIDAGMHLFFGALSLQQNGLSPNNRPTSWDPNFYHKR